MRIKVCIFLGMTLTLLLAVGSIMAQQDTAGSYDPAIHYYRESMGDISTLNTRAGTLNSTGVDGIVQPAAIEAGGRFFPQGNLSTVKSPDNIRSSACGEDYYVDFYYIPETVIDAFGGATDTVFPPSTTSWQLDNNNGLDGVYYCVGGSCTVSLCSTSQFGNNPGTLRFSYN